MTDLLEPTAVYSWSCRTDGEPSCGQKSVCSSWTPDFILGRKSNSQYSQCCLLLHSNGRLKMDRRASLKWSHPSATSAFPWHLNPDAVTSSFAIKERRRRSRKKKKKKKERGKTKKSTLSFPDEALVYFIRRVSFWLGGKDYCECYIQAYVSKVPWRKCFIYFFISLIFYLSRNRESRWGITDDFATSFLHFSLFSIALWDLANPRPHFLMLSSHLFLCLPCLLPHFTVPCKMVLARPNERDTWPYHWSFRLFTIVRRSSCDPIACWILTQLVN